LWAQPPRERTMASAMDRAVRLHKPESIATVGSILPVWTSALDRIPIGSCICGIVLATLDCKHLHTEAAKLVLATGKPCRRASMLTQYVHVRLKVLALWPAVPRGFCEKPCHWTMPSKASPDHFARGRQLVAPWVVRRRGAVSPQMGSTPKLLWNSHGSISRQTIRRDHK
jgi:hypothetical protein